MPTADILSDTSQHKLLLHFHNNTLEKDYQLQQERFVQVAMRGGLISSLVIWGLSLVVIYFLIPAHFSVLAPTVILATFPLFLSMIYATYHDRFLGYFHWMAAASNLVAGILLLVLFYFVEVSDYALLTGLVLLVFFGLYTYRFRLLTGVLLSVLYMACFQLYISFFSTSEPGDYTLMTLYAWVAVGVGWMATRMSENNDRESFIDKLTIDAKNKLEAQLLVERKEKEFEIRLTKARVDTLAYLAMDMAHEVQNPLQFVNNFSEVNLELLEELEEYNQTGDKEGIAEVQKDLLTNCQKINEHGQRISKIVEELQEKTNKAQAGELELPEGNEHDFSQ